MNNEHDKAVNKSQQIGGRQMTPLRRLYYFLGMPLLQLVFTLLTLSYRTKEIIGSAVAERIIDDSENLYAPCYWHQYHVLLSDYMRTWIARGFKASFLVSPSVDGEVPSRIAKKWGAEVIRGSANRTGSLALRDMQQTMKRGVAIITTADGPNGPQHEFKSGAILMARIGGAALVPLSCAAKNAWYLNRWDKFMIPKPFTQVVYAIGEPIKIPDGTPLDELEQYREQMESAINELTAQCKVALSNNT